MNFYNDYDLMLYLYIYSFIGWLFETVYFYIKDGKVRNRGLLNEPLLLGYGLDMVLLILAGSVSQSHMVLQCIVHFFRVIFVRMLSTFFLDRISGAPIRLSDLRMEKKEAGQQLLVDALVATVTFATFKVLHPFVYLGVSLLPVLLVKILCFIFFFLVLCDFILVWYASAKGRKYGLGRYELQHFKKAGQLQTHLREEKLTLGYRLANAFHKRIERAYPALYKYTEDYQGVQVTDATAIRKGIVFAEGICLDKMVWVFLLMSLIGCGIETVYVRLVGGVWMRRSGVVFGPFSVVWGIGAALLTIALSHLSVKKKIHVFLGGFFLGGSYEYMASVVLEVLFHTRFWDYTDMPLNIGGRTNIPYMLGWGLVALGWICYAYPFLSRLIESIPPLAGKIITWALLLLLCLDLAVTGAVMLRYTTRKTNPAPANQMERYLDQFYPDGDVEELWPNLVLS